MCVPFCVAFLIAFLISPVTSVFELSARQEAALCEIIDGKVEVKPADSLHGGNGVDLNIEKFLASNNGVDEEITLVSMLIDNLNVSNARHNCGAVLSDRQRLHQLKEHGVPLDHFTVTKPVPVSNDDQYIRALRAKGAAGLPHGKEPNPNNYTPAQESALQCFVSRLHFAKRLFAWAVNELKCSEKEKKNGKGNELDMHTALKGIEKVASDNCETDEKFKERWQRLEKVENAPMHELLQIFDPPHFKDMPAKEPGKAGSTGISPSQNGNKTGPRELPCLPPKKDTDSLKDAISLGRNALAEEGRTGTESTGTDEQETEPPRHKDLEKSTVIVTTVRLPSGDEVTMRAKYCQ